MLIPKLFSVGHAELLVRGGMVVTPQAVEQVDLACVDGCFAAIDATGWRADRVLDAHGLHVLPGVIDTQVHFREPGRHCASASHASPQVYDFGLLKGEVREFVDAFNHTLVFCNADGWAAIMRRTRSKRRQDRIRSLRAV